MPVVITGSCSSWREDFQLRHNHADGHRGRSSLQRNKTLQLIEGENNTLPLPERQFTQQRASGTPASCVAAS